MLHGEPSPFTEEVRVYLRDVYDHSVQLLDVIETSRDLVVGLMDIYLSAISNRTNEVMKALTIMASIFIPLTFIVGVYGMNFEYMPELHWRWAYHAVWGVMVAIVIGLLLWFRSRGWIGGRDGRSQTDGG
jgi:magnesium transporter